MGRPSTPTGRAKRIRVRLLCHMGIEMDKRFWESYASRRRAVRQDHLRRCLLVGFLIGRHVKSARPTSTGQVLSVQIEILADDPDYRVFLDEYKSRWTGDDRAGWIRETVLAGHDLISGNAALSQEPSAERRPESPGEPGSEDPEKLLGGLFSCS